ncbi:cytochrome c oxidase subunit 4 isoform 1, mitochondrial-like [Rhynchophorus ferrugineus]|uniref:cytochrome c oxidase subunit 4 isoform 1, mitochondrial-like n=1 Tax=Rhynchophorus ferrugineus TaxID=354439 RepID=UPI003FCD8542
MFSLRSCVRNALRTRASTMGIRKAYISNFERSIIGRREIVGFGFNGQPSYVDRDDFPFPAIRWKEPSPEIGALREKEKGDWNDLSCEEKKELYRASFCQTFEEFQVTHLGQWKSVLAHILFLCTGGIWLFLIYKMTIYKDMLPDSFSQECREHQFRRYIDLKANPIRGLASKWDYDNDCWKK